MVVFAGESYYFVFEKWFAVEKGCGKVEREVMAADRGLGFSKVRSFCLHWTERPRVPWFLVLADRTNGRAYATVLRLSVCRLWRYVLWLNGAT